MGAIWYKLYPNEITKSIMETGYYENETEEAIILMEPMITLQPFASCGTDKYGITMLNFLNTYLYTRSSQQDITKLGSIAQAFELAEKSPLYTRFSSQPVPYEGHNNIIGTLISKRGNYSGLSTNGGAAALSLYIECYVYRLWVGDQQQYPTAAQLSGSGTKVDETEPYLSQTLYTQ